jgi:hypothetical protein
MRLRDRSAEPSRHPGAASPESEATLKTLQVMAGLVPAISIRRSTAPNDRDHRHKAGDDVRGPLRPEQSRTLDDAGVTYFAVQPPSIDRLAPDIWLAASEHRNTASAAT